MLTVKEKLVAEASRILGDGWSVVALLSAIAQLESPSTLRSLGLEDPDCERLWQTAKSIASAGDQGCEEAPDYRFLIAKALELAGPLAVTSERGSISSLWNVCIFKDFDKLLLRGDKLQLDPSKVATLREIVDRWIGVAAEVDDEFGNAFTCPDTPEEENEKHLVSLALWEAVHYREFMGLWREILRTLDKLEVLAFISWAQYQYAHAQSEKVLPIPDMAGFDGQL